MLLSDPDALDARAALLGEPHMLALEAWRRDMTSEARPLPHADPLDGGDAARVLLLLETPGPGAARLRFVSRDNPTGTGRNLRRFLEQAGIARGDVLIWNAVPWVVHAPGARNRAVRAGEVRDGLAMLPGFLTLLPRLAAVVTMGRVARGAAATIEAARPEAAVIAVPHPVRRSSARAQRWARGSRRGSRRRPRSFRDPFHSRPSGASAPAPSCWGRGRGPPGAAGSEE